VTAASLSAANRPSIELLWFEDCPNHAAARQMLIELVPIHALGAIVRIIDATDPTVAASHRFPGRQLYVDSRRTARRCSAEKNGG